MPIYREIYDGPPRSHGGRTNKRWVTIHCTQNTASAAGEAGYAKRRSDSVSSHYYVDDSRIVQSLDTDLRAHHVGSTIGNNGGISYEVTGLIEWSRGRWLNSVAWGLLATAIRRDCAEHGIPARLLSVSEIKAGHGGIMTHNQARLAWGGTSHTDPGPNFPMDHLLASVEEDMPSEHEIWTHRLPWTDTWVRDSWGLRDDGWRAKTMLQSTYGHSRRASDRAAELLAGQAAILARLEGRDVTEAIRGELDRHRNALVDEMGGDLVEAVAAELSAELADLPAEAIEQAVARALSRTRLSVAPAVDDGEAEQ